MGEKKHVKKLKSIKVSALTNYRKLRNIKEASTSNKRSKKERKIK